jgi:hypothetical protein
VLVLALADVWIGGILALSGTALGILGSMFVERREISAIHRSIDVEERVAASSR